MHAQQAGARTAVVVIRRPRLRAWARVVRDWRRLSAAQDERTECCVGPIATPRSCRAEHACAADVHASWRLVEVALLTWHSTGVARLRPLLQP